MGKKRGRPKGFDGKSCVCRARISKEDDYIFKKICEKEGLSRSEGLRVALKALKYMSENGLISCATENKNDDYLNYCSTENDDFDDELW